MIDSLIFCYAMYFESVICTAAVKGFNLWMWPIFNILPVNCVTPIASTDLFKHFYIHRNPNQPVSNYELLKTDQRLAYIQLSRLWLWQTKWSNEKVNNEIKWHWKVHIRSSNSLPWTQMFRWTPDWESFGELLSRTSSSCRARWRPWRTDQMFRTCPFPAGQTLGLHRRIAVTEMG